MTWTAPNTAVAGSPVSSVDFNKFVRDNLNQTAPAVASQNGSYFVGSGNNAIIEEMMTGDYIATSQTSASTSYVNLATVGPSVSVHTQVRAIVFLYAQLVNSLKDTAVWMSYDVSGATTSAAADDRAVMLQGIADNDGQTMSAGILHEALTPGTNTFTAKYRVSGNTGTWSTRRIAVLPF
jgi:hypothetical protein